MNRKNGLANSFVFAKIINRKDKKSGVPVVNDYADTRIFL